MRFTIEEIRQAVSGRVLAAGAEAFGGISTDTRKVQPGDLFVALVGEAFDGHDFLAKAFENGAAGAVVSRCGSEAPEGKTLIGVGDTLLAYQNIARRYRERFFRPIVAVTGSNGKTTTKEMIAAVLGARYRVCKTQANYNNEIGLPLTLLSMKEDEDAAVVEMGMRGLGQIAQLTRIAHPTIGVVTNVNETHIELLGSLENIARAKSELVQALPPTGKAILCYDDERVRRMAEIAACEAVTYGLGEGADIRADEIEKSSEGVRFLCRTPQGELVMELPAFGLHNVQNALAATAVGLELGMTLEEIKTGLANFVPTGMRFAMQTIDGALVINDAYNAGPRSTAASIDSMADIAKGRKIVVFGDMLELGEAGEQLHRGIGKKAAEKGVDLLLTVGTLAAFAAQEAAEAGITARACTTHKEAADYLKQQLQPGDTVLVKGSRGMKMETVIELVKQEGGQTHE